MTTPTPTPHLRYPRNAIFDIDTLINEAQPNSILLLGNFEADFLHSYQQQKALLGQECSVKIIRADNIESLSDQTEAYDLAIAISLFEHLPQEQGNWVLSKLRDVASRQYCACLPISSDDKKGSWHINQLYAFALKRVGIYLPDEPSDSAPEVQFGLFKYNIASYKNKPNWLNSDNWANPENWGKYRW